MVTRHETPMGYPVYFDEENHLYFLEHTERTAKRARDGSEAGQLYHVPGVTGVTDVIDKSGGLVWWAWQNGIEIAYQHLEEYWAAWYDERFERGVDVAYPNAKGLEAFIRAAGFDPYTKRDAKGKVGSRVHKWVEAKATGKPLPDVMAEDAGYIAGIEAFFADAKPTVHDTETVAGSRIHGYAGTADLCADVDADLVVSAARGTRERFTGRGLFDYKTSKKIGENYLFQIDAYEVARVESGYGKTDFQAVVRVTPDGTYEVVRNYCPPGSFLVSLGLYKQLEQTKDAKPGARRRKPVPPVLEVT